MADFARASKQVGTERSACAAPCAAHATSSGQNSAPIACCACPHGNAIAARFGVAAERTSRGCIRAIAYGARVKPLSADFRRRAIAAAAALVTVVLGLASRRYGSELPEFVAAYAGDTLWALLVYLVVTALAPSAAVAHRALAALVFSFAIETSQLYHAPWIDAIRATRLGSLVLGSGFVWSDFACYAAGIGFGAATEVVAARTTHDSSQR